ncbi:structure-specific endonuclease subunit SLX1-like protein [Medicago truncatula]|uniref:Structure-specific endonuclease subunit SLX1-like protein n=1 Tax=Medicago truncatula TaxID=3880 RepID=A0A072TJD2_MEDTR|nr:structure-specific endonuclease subunit SLX1-like protein [Medicago truncatula]
MRTLSQTFRSIKRPISNPKLSKCSSSSPKKSELKPKSESSSWCVYLILSTNHPIKTYVGVTTNFPRRLKEHNGDLKGGAKASRAGRPWICACIVCGFTNRSEVEAITNVILKIILMGMERKQSNGVWTTEKTKQRNGMERTKKEVKERKDIENETLC